MITESTPFSVRQINSLVSDGLASSGNLKHVTSVHVHVVNESLNVTLDCLQLLQQTFLELVPFSGPVFKKLGPTIH